MYKKNKVVKHSKFFYRYRFGVSMIFISILSGLTITKFSYHMPFTSVYRSLDDGLFTAALRVVKILNIDNQQQVASK